MQGKHIHLHVQSRDDRESEHLKSWYALVEFNEPLIEEQKSILVNTLVNSYSFLDTHRGKLQNSSALYLI